VGGAPAGGASSIPVAGALGAFFMAIALFSTIGFEEQQGRPKLHPKEEGKLLKRLKEIDDSEQYALIAKAVRYIVIHLPYEEIRQIPDARPLMLAKARERLGLAA
jgi:hypothetical protein